MHVYVYIYYIYKFWPIKGRGVLLMSLMRETQTQPLCQRVHVEKAEWEVDLFCPHAQGTT